MKYKAFDTVTASKPYIDDEGRIRVPITASTSRVDRHGESVEQTFDLSDYLKNPVLLWNHTRDKSDYFYAGLPIGHVEKLQVSNDALTCELVFASEKANPLAPVIGNSFLERSIRAVSIGFDFTHKTETIDENGEPFTTLHGAKLVEISACVIPVNPDAVAKAMLLRKTESSQQSKRYKIAKKVKAMEMTQEELNKFLQQLAALLGLPSEATPDQILAAASEALAKENEAEQVLAETEAKDLKEAAAKVCALKMVLSDLQEKSTAEKAKAPSRIEEKIKKAIDNGFVSPSKAKSVREYAGKYGEKALDDYLVMASPIFSTVPVQTKSSDSHKRTSAQELSILKQLGLKPEDLENSK